MKETWTLPLTEYDENLEWTEDRGFPVFRSAVEAVLKVKWQHLLTLHVTVLYP